MTAFIFVFVTCLSIIAGVNSDQESIYEILRDHRLPMGLLPTGVNEFTFDSKTERFEVHMDQECKAKFESELHYAKNISGTFKYGQIVELSGIKAQELFLWFDVKGIRVDVPSSGLIYFDVGVVFKQFSLSLFEIPRECIVAVKEPFELESQSWELRYEPNQENFAINVL